MKGLLIKQQRMKQQMTQEELALGICSVSYLSKIEHELIKPSEEIYELLGDRLGLDLRSLNDSFDSVIYDRLHSWHEAIKHNDYTTMIDIHQSLRESLQHNYHIELNNLFMIFEFRYAFTLNQLDAPSEKIALLRSIAETSNLEFQYYFHKILGYYYLMENEWHCSLKELKQAKATIAELPIDDSELYYHMSYLYSRLGNFAESILYAEKALEMYQKTLHYTKVIECCMLIAINYNLLSVYEVAEEYFQKILRSANSYLTHEVRAKVYHNLGYICINNKQYDEALDYLEAALALKESEQMNPANTLYLLALTHYSIKDFPKAKLYAEKGHKIAAEFEDLKYLYKHFILLHRIEGTMQQDIFIQTLKEEIIPYFEKANELEEYKDALKLLGEIYYEGKRYKLSAQYFKIATQSDFQGKEVLA
ncbi:transcriptional regulator [Thalassobacillus devorans]|uniref:Transcriptional regulator n=1 Tax=Thalassobacillus devorans TaxID=279813 RepID=A0ABQ1PQK5_9BACI|nr:tetratricopeptide repeat protein [Thalassobacillus devorans]NIK30310.1 tetratricopeptide (TPR) repeat protein [Thalassobacillus devorans]GGD01278.1 transcriptional regulator [Thalassobacillus devorans]